MKSILLLISMAGLAAAAPIFKSKFNEFNSFRRPANIQPVTSDAANSQEDAYFCFYPVIKRPNELFTIYNKREQAVTDFANPEDGVCIGFYYNSKREESFTYTSGPKTSRRIGNKTVGAYPERYRPFKSKF